MPASYLTEDGPDLIPFDLGTIWGLNRSSFIGVLIGHEGDRTFEKLVHIEQTLSDVMSRSGSPDALPKRMWLPIAPLLLPLGPLETSDIFTAVTPGRDASTPRVSSEWPPESVGLGLFIEAPTAMTAEFTSALKNWCRELVTRRFAISDIAIVLHLLRGASVGEGGLPPIFHELTRMELPLPIEVMSLHRVYEYVAPISLAGLEIDDLLLEGFDSERGLYFYSWVKEAVKLWHPEEARQEIDNYSSIMREMRSLAGKFPNAPVHSPAVRVVSDITRMGISDIEEFIQQFLILIDRYLPDRIHPLLQAFATAFEADARSTALAFAARSDSMMDAWLEGHFTSPNERPKSSDLRAPNVGSFVDVYVLALLRRYVHGLNCRQITEIIAELQDSLSPDLRDLCCLCFGQISEDQFLKNYRVERLLYALRSGIELRLNKLDIPSLELAPPNVWWLLSALSITYRRITGWLELDHNRRAVIGLCTAAEWIRVCVDPEVERQVMDCRRERPFKFLNTP